MSNLCVAARPSVEDSLIKGQIHRWGSRPLVNDNNTLSKFSSFKGRGYILLEIGHTIIREPYRAFKNFLIIAERMYNFVRSFFESLFREPQTTWKETGKRFKELLSSVVALAMRPLTLILDLFKLLGGVFIPALAIKSNKSHEGDEGGTIEENDSTEENNAAQQPAEENPSLRSEVEGA